MPLCGDEKAPILESWAQTHCEEFIFKKHKVMHRFCLLNFQGLQKRFFRLTVLLPTGLQVVQLIQDKQFTSEGELVPLLEFGEALHAGHTVKQVLIFDR